MRTSFLHPVLPLCILALNLICSCAGAAEITLASQNLNRFFDDKNDGQQEKVVTKKKYHQRLSRLVEKIATELRFADILALQEIENINILHDVSKQIEAQYGVKYRPILLEGNDISGIDVGYLIKAQIPVKSVKALFHADEYGFGDKRLFARPPLLIEICPDACLKIVNVHLRSMRGLRSPDQGKRVALKRQLQAEKLARWINYQQQNQTASRLVITGDFNALTPSDRYVDSVGIILGNPDQQRPRRKSKDLIEQDLVDVTRRIPVNKRYSFLYRKKKQQLDYLLVSRNLDAEVQSVRFTRIDYRFSDHAALIAEITLR